MNHNQASDGACNLSPTERAEARAKAARGEMDRAREHLGRAKVEILNQKLREIDRLRSDPECPQTVLMLTSSGLLFVQVQTQTLPIDPECMSVQMMPKVVSA